MPLLDLSLVSTTLIRLLARYVPMSPVWGGPAPTTLTITGDPPDLLRDANTDHVLGVYMFHAEENGHFKNQPAPVGNVPPVRFREMGLNLYYVLSAFGGKQFGLQAFEREQKLMGIALKAFHDYPIVDRTTAIANPAFTTDPLVFPPALRGETDRVRLVLHPASMEDVNKLWTAATVPIRLSTVYQVSVVMLEAEQSTSGGIPVLTFTATATPIALVFLTASESTLTFTPPGATAAQTTVVSPAQVAVGGTFRIKGHGLGGAAASVRLANPLWSGPPDVDVSGWVVAATAADTQLEMAVATPVGGRDIVPGLYSVAVRAGSTTSNAIPIAVTPALTGLSPGSAGPGDAVNIDGGPFAGPEIRAVEVHMGPAALSPVTGTPAPGEFRIQTTGPLAGRRIVARVPDNRPEVFQSGRHIPVWVVVNGVASPPIQWLAVP